uniref:NADH-ubiquinone oxidoreductase chain 3 n=1 Tax=Teladorsagia circumcincta TaxID=45464 RepID=A0A1E1GJ09_TELCI|nr:NADH dehydrogenase subunit 3 [Teladorsagia circumcincta]BAV82841.1 NADH dehydrogenase subunit 3 [Teladorsagia circumcincta]
MMILMIVSSIAVFLLVLLYLLNFVISVKKNELLKVSTFESGFVSVGKVQNSFSIHFFIIMLMFVIFDLEVVMFLGLLVSDLNSMIGFMMLMIFIIAGFYMEWWYGKLTWVV